MALFYHLQGKSLDMVWEEMGQRYGYHEDVAYSIEFKGSSGQATMNELMDKLHNNPLKELNGAKLVRVDDILKGVTLVGDQSLKINLPKSNVIKLYFDDETVVSVRPSGTEPKIKFYIGVVGESLEDAAKKPAKIYASLKATLGIE